MALQILIIHINMIIVGLRIELFKRFLEDFIRIHLIIHIQALSCIDNQLFKIGPKIPNIHVLFAENLRVYILKDHRYFLYIGLIQSSLTQIIFNQ